jgi:hypothetical protein
MAQWASGRAQWTAQGVTHLASAETKHTLPRQVMHALVTSPPVAQLRMR